MSVNPIKKVFLLFLLILFIPRSNASGENKDLNDPLDSISKGLFLTSDTVNGFCISKSGRSVTMLISSVDYPGVIRAFTDLQRDIHAVSDAKPGLIMDTIPAEKKILIAGTIGSPIIDSLVHSGLVTADLKGKWETFRIQIVKNPFPGVEEALVIAGSDKRGTIYGIYELSKIIGVSPWYWWADVNPEHGMFYV